VVVQQQCGLKKIKMEGRLQKRLQQVSADEKGRLIQAEARLQQGKSVE